MGEVVAVSKALKFSTRTLRGYQIRTSTYTAIARINETVWKKHTRCISRDIQLPPTNTNILEIKLDRISSTTAAMRLSSNVASRALLN